MEEKELVSFQIITHAGGAKSKCFEAMKAAKNGQFELAEVLINEAQENFLEAHKVHATLIQKEANGESVLMTLLLSHAEDQLMNAEMSKDMALEFINVYKLISK